MSYNYATEKQKLFTEEGIEILRKVEKNVDRLLSEAGAFINSRAFDGVTGDSWTMLAALDYLVANNKVKLVSQKGMTQDWVYAEARN